MTDRELLELAAKAAARYRWLADYLVSDRTEYDDALVACADKSDMDAVIDAATPIKLA